MIINKSVKFTLSAVLLAAGAMAYADGPVKLKDNTTVAWSEFVGVINNPNSLVGSADSTALHDARVAYLKADTIAKEKAQAVKDAQKSYDDANANVADWGGQITRINSQISAYERRQKPKTDSISKLNTSISDLENQIAALTVTTKGTPEWLTILQSQVSGFEEYYDKYIAYIDDESADKGEYTDEATIYYSYSGTTSATVLYISFSQPTTDKPVSAASSWTTTTESGLFDFISGRKKVKSLYLVLTNEKAISAYGSNLVLVTATVDEYDVISFISTKITDLIDGGKYDEETTTVTDTEKEQSLTNEKSTQEERRGQLEREYNQIEGQIGTLESQLTPLETRYNELTTPDANGKTGLQRLYDAIGTAQTNQNTADQTAASLKSTLDSEQQAYNKAVEESQSGELENYKEVTLMEDITGATMITGTFSGSIDGNGHVITLANGVANLFSRVNEGHLSNIAINGATAIAGAQSSPFYNNVAIWNGTSGSFYNVNNVQTTANSLGQLGFLARDFFGVDFATKSIAVLAENLSNQVYNITAYTSATTAPSYYVHISDNGFTNINSTTETGALTFENPNTLVKSSKPLSQFVNPTNVYYNDGTDNVCPNMVITDANASFYSPEKIVAQNLELKRSFKAGYNSVCLPFQFKTSYLTDDEDLLCTYDQETTEKFWFKKIGDAIEANTPMLLISKNGLNITDTEVTIEATPVSQIVVDEGDADDGSKSYGTFKTVTRDEFAGAVVAAQNKIYGLVGDTFRPAAADTETKAVKFNAFRMFIFSPIAEPQGAPRRIGIRNEFGQDITEEVETAIKGVNGGTTGLDVIGGQGVITISSDADHGMVPVYSLDGKMVANANVTAGTTTVNVKGGIYIVLGQKVLVK